jgi:signal transduction histidine kinase/ligand-binding sensor domain-containing protein/DNA-binding response OmpR family regulator
MKQGFLLKTLLTLLILLIPTTISAYEFTRINTSNSGLSYDGVSKITQDSRGFIWIGTFKGLNRYDGSHFKVYYKEDLGLPSDFIHTIVESSEGDLWIGTDMGVTRYRYALDRFEPLTCLSNKGDSIRNKVTFIKATEDNRILMLVNEQGFFGYDIQKETLTQISYEDVGVHGFRKMLLANDGTIWLSKYHANLFRADKGIENLREVDLGGWFEGDEIEGIFQAKGNKIYVASNRHGISLVHPINERVECLFQLPKGQVLQDAFLQDNRIFWLSTTSGVWSYDLETGNSKFITNKLSDDFSIAGNYVFSTFVDRDGGIWIGTKDGGVSYSGAFQRRFEKQYEGLKGLIVSGFAEGEDGSIWITTEQGGLYEYDYRTQKLSKFTGAVLPRTLCSPCYDNGFLWLGSLQGLYRLDTNRRIVKNYGVLHRSSGVNDPRVYNVFKSREGVLYASTTLGVFRYDSNEDSFVEIPEFNGIFVTDMAEDSQGMIWISTYANGLYYWDCKTPLPPKHFRSADLPANTPSKISSVLVDSRGWVWMIGFSEGFFRIYPEKQKYKVYNKHTLPSLPSDVFFNAIEDKSGILWLASDAGLVRFNPLTESVSVYSKMDGLLDTKLTNSSFEDSKGRLYFGSDNGFVAFAPDDISVNQNVPKVVMTNLRIGDREAELPCNFDMIEEIVLDYADNSFGFDISIPGFMSAARTHLQCMLEGHDHQWRDISYSRSIFYYNVPPGQYTLMLRAASDSGWIDSHSPITVRVRPPFWGSAAGILIIVSIVLAFTTVIVFRSRKIVVEKRKKEAEAYRKAKDEEAFQEKMNFFSHVIHEIRTPLTLIHTPLMNVMSKQTLDEETKKDLEVMQNNTVYLTRLVKELLDYVRIEKKGYTLNPENVNLCERIGSMIYDYQENARNRNLKLDYDPEIAHATINVDSSSLDKILNNLLINALKYSNSFIYIRLYQEGKNVCVRFENDGEPIPPDAREEIFKPFFQSASGSRANGVGIGLPLARTLARMQSGDVILLDDEQNTVFMLKFPAVSIDEHTYDNDIVEANNQDDKKLQLLIVDDNTEFREYLSSKFAEAYDVLIAGSGETALEILKSQNVDMLITDISMSGISGLNLCTEVRSNIEISHLPIIILSARTSVESKIQAMQSGADLYIEKPFDLEYLRASVKNLLDRRELMKSALTTDLEANVGLFGLPKRDEEFLTRFDKLIQDNLANSELSVEWIADNMNMSQSTLTRKIRKMLNTSPNNYIRIKRLTIAAKLLKDSHGNNISDIGYVVGFSSLSYFAKCFKEHYGMTPTEYST